MNSENLNRWLSLGANIGVVIGLILLIVELNQNSELVRAQIHQARTDNYVADMMALADTEFLLPAWEKMSGSLRVGKVEDLDNLDAIERARVRRYLQARMADYDNLYYQYSHGYIEEDYYRNKILGSIRRLAPFWRALGLTDGMTEAFHKEVDRIVAEE